MATIHQILPHMYDVPGYMYAVWGASVIVAWGVLIHSFRDKKSFRLVNAALALLVAVGIVCITLVLRTPRERGIVLQPFSIFELAAEYSDVYNQIVLNIVLFFPLGLSLPTVFSKSRKHPFVWTLMSGAALSLVVEGLQWALSRGLAEVDDMIFNVLGTACGLFSYGTAKAFDNQKTRKRRTQKQGDAIV